MLSELHCLWHCACAVSLSLVKYMLFGFQHWIYGVHSAIYNTYTTCSAFSMHACILVGKPPKTTRGTCLICLHLTHPNKNSDFPAVFPRLKLYLIWTPKQWVPYSPWHCISSGLGERGEYAGCNKLYIRMNGSAASQNSQWYFSSLALST